MSTKPTDDGGAHQPTPTAQRSDGGGPEIPNPRVNRREMLKITGAAGAATVGLSGAGDRVGMVEDAQALGPALPVGVAAGTAAGHYVVDEYLIDGDTEFDEDDVTEQNIYQAGTSVADGREDFVDEMEFNYFDNSSEPQDTPFGNVAWEESRVTGARELVNGESDSDTTAELREQLREQATVSLVNIFERWNTGVNAMTEQAVAQADENVEVLFMDDDDGVGDPEYPLDAVPGDDHPEWDPVEATEVDGDYVIWERELSSDFLLPKDPKEIDELDDEYHLLAFGLRPDADNLVAPIPTDEDESPGENGDIFVETDDLERVDVLDTTLIGDIYERVKTAKDEIYSDLDTYVENLSDGLSQGAIDPADIIGPSEIANQFEDSDQMTRLATELVAIGGDVPDAAGYRATISHDDLQADELEGLLFPQFDTDDPPSVRPGTTIEAAELGLAYFGWEDQLSADDETQFETTVLSGDSDLEIIDATEIDGEETVDEADDEAGGDGDVVIFSGDDPPDPLADPSEHDGWSVVIQGEDETHAVDVSEVVEDGDSYTVEGTPFESGAAIEEARLVPPVDYEPSHEYVSDPTEVDSDQTLAELEAQRELIEDLEEELEDDDDGAAWWPSAPSAPSVDDFGSQLAGIVVIAAIVVSVVWSVVSDAVPILGN